MHNGGYAMYFASMEVFLKCEHLSLVCCKGGVFVMLPNGYPQSTHTKLGLHLLMLQKDKGVIKFLIQLSILGIQC